MATSPLSRLVISYSHQDIEQIRPYIEVLKETHRVWYDNNIHAGTPDWWLDILTNIDRCKIFVPVISRNYLQSIYCMAELDYAVEMNKAILPLLLDKSELPEKIRMIQAYKINSTGSIEDFRKQNQENMAYLSDQDRLGNFDPPSPLPIHPPLPTQLQNSLSKPFNTLGKKSIDICYVKDVHALWDDAKLGDVAAYFTGKGRPRYLVIKNRTNGCITGWIKVYPIVKTADWAFYQWMDLLS